MLPFVLASAFIICSQQRASAVVPDNVPAPKPITFSDGAVATPSDHCGDGDVCATIAYPNGDLLTIYSEGAAYCQPYFLHFVLTHGERTVYEFSRMVNHDVLKPGMIGTRCGNSHATQMTMDHGLVHMTVDERLDGSLWTTFSPTKQALQQEAPQEEH
ncbi:MAG TPA: hypothetical protein VFB22_02755 [Candidatus Baltobacteraceae bacterium]|nr:hypothetical protein [Candidatus Baltobacteraceae bacterium]